VWGLIGPHYARFSNFVQPPREVAQFLKQTLRLRAKRYLGHNPAAGAMIVLLLISLIFTTLTGMAVYGAGDNAGPLAGLFGSSAFYWQKILEEVHEFFANFTLMLVFIHVAGVIVESLIHRENLIRAMFNGYKRADSQEPAKENLS
jgi:cytochrome b